MANKSEKKITADNYEKVINLEGADFSEVQIKNITAIVKNILPKLSGLYGSCASGGGFEHIFIQLKDETWLVFHNVSGQVSVSEKYKSWSSVYKAFWDKEERVTGKYLKYFTTKESEQEDDFRAVDTISKDILEGNIQKIEYKKDGGAMQPTDITLDNYQKVIADNTYGFTDEAKENITAIVKNILPELSGSYAAFHSGGGFFHLFLQLKDKTWLCFHSQTGDVTLSDKFEDFDTVADAFFEEPEQVTGKEVKRPEDEELFQGVEVITKAILENKFVPIDFGNDSTSAKISDAKLWKLIDKADWPKDHDFKRISVIYDALDKETFDALKAFYDKLMDELDTKFKADWLKPNGKGIPVSDDGWMDLRSTVIGNGKKFYKAITAAKLRKMAKEGGFYESFGYSFQKPSIKEVGGRPDKVEKLEISAKSIERAYSLGMLPPDFEVRYLDFGNSFPGYSLREISDYNGDVQWYDAQDESKNIVAFSKKIEKVIGFIRPDLAGASGELDDKVREILKKYELLKANSKGKPRAAIGVQEVLTPYLVASLKAESDGLVLSVTVNDKNSFSFIYPGDENCKVEVTYDPSSGVAMTQDYQNNNPPETDDISLGSFLGYLIPKSAIRPDQKQQLENAGFDVSKITKVQADLITEPSDGPENFYQDGELKFHEAFTNWEHKLLRAGLSKSEIEKAAVLNFGDKKAQGGSLQKEFSISEIKELLDREFPDSFGFTLHNLQPGTREAEVRYDFSDGLNGIQDKSIRLSFPTIKDHGIAYHLYQGAENTYINFLLVSREEGYKAYIGSFGFKDQGDVSSEYITRFMVFLHNQFGLPFQVKHEVFAAGGGMGLSRYKPEQINGEWQIKDTDSKKIVAAKFIDAGLPKPPYAKESEAESVAFAMNQTLAGEMQNWGKDGGKPNDFGKEQLDRDKQYAKDSKNFKKFIEGLENLTLKHGFVLHVTGGVRYVPNVGVQGIVYSNDLSSGDIIPAIVKWRNGEVENNTRMEHGGKIKRSDFQLGEAIRLIRLAEDGKPENATRELEDYINLYTAEKKEGNIQKRLGRSLDSIIAEYKNALAYVQEMPKKHNCDNALAKMLADLDKTTITFVSSKEKRGIENQYAQRLLGKINTLRTYIKEINPNQDLSAYDFIDQF